MSRKQKKQAKRKAKAEALKAWRAHPRAETVDIVLPAKVREVHTRVTMTRSDDA